MTDKTDPPGERPQAPKFAFNREVLIKVFNEWQKEHDKNPEEFDEMKDFENYGEVCADYFQELWDKLF